MIITIDGPAGSGKSTIAKLIAEDLGLVYLDTGAMYRLVTLKALNDGILGNLDKIIKMLDNLNIDIKENGFYLDNIDVSEEIRKPVVSENVSDIAVIREVREKMVDLQRKFSESKNVILDGRDIGTVVFPNADVKIFLIADAKERANRRYKELVAKGENVEFRNGYYYLIGDKEPFTGTIEFLNDNGDITKGNFVNGIVDGVAKTYSSDGRLLSETPYENGKKNGLFLQFLRVIERELTQ